MQPSVSSLQLVVVILSLCLNSPGGRSSFHVLLVDVDPWVKSGEGHFNFQILRLPHTTPGVIKSHTVDCIEDFPVTRISFACHLAVSLLTTAILPDTKYDLILQIHSCYEEGAYQTEEEHQTAFIDTGHYKDVPVQAGHIPPTLPQLWECSPAHEFPHKASLLGYISTLYHWPHRVSPKGATVKHTRFLADCASHHKNRDREGSKQSWTSFLLVLHWDY